MSIRGCLVLCLVVSWSSVSLAASDLIRQFQQPYEMYANSIASSPAKVLKQLQAENLTEDVSPLIRAQHHAILSQTYYALSYPQKALDAAQYSLSFIDSKLQPWLYHTVKLSESLALDTAGRPNAGLKGANAAVVWAQLNQDELLLIDALYVRGTLRNSLVDYQGALGDLQKAYDLAPQEGSRLTKGNVAGMLALVYEYRSEDRLAIPLFQEAVDYNRRTSNDLELSISLYGLGRAYKNIGNLELGRSFLMESKHIAQSIGDEQGVAYALKELAGLDLAAKKFELAQTQLLDALQIFNKSDNRYMLLDTYQTMAVISLEVGQLSLAKRYIDAANKVLSPDTMPIQKINLDEVRANYLAKTGEFEQAYTLLQSIQQPRKRYYSTQSTQQLHSMRSQYEIDVKERENELLENQNKLQQANLSAAQTQNLQLMLLFGATLIICLLLVILAYRTKKNRAQLEALANTDGLTGLYNRRHTLVLLEQQIQMASRHHLELSVAIVDIDFFKKINDNYGHAVGDNVLQAFGILCLEMFRSTDIVGRIGGEEFVIILPHTKLQDAYKTLKSLSLKVKSLSLKEPIPDLQVSISCGLTQYEKSMSGEELMLKCDEALYAAKRMGRDRINVANF